MSTRAQITVEGQPIKMYKHCDGYPDGVLPWLVPALKHFVQQRGQDEEYMIARIVAAYAVAEASERAAYVAEDPKRAATYGYDKPAVLGLGLDLEWHGDIEWAYIVRFNPRGGAYVVADLAAKGAVLEVHEVRRVGFGEFEPSERTLERTIPLTA